MRKCRDCGCEFEPKRATRSCPACASKRVQQTPTRVINTAFIRILKAMGCADCGWVGHFSQMQFDHLPGVTKLGHISQMANASVPIEVLIREANKCEVVCANCHALRTWTRGKVRGNPPVREQRYSYS